MLEKLGFKKRTHIGISVSPNNLIELVCIDKKTKEVVKYASANIKYNVAIREIMDFQEFIEVAESLFEEVGLDPSECSATINIPNVHFAVTTMDAVDKNYINDNLSGEIEDLYIFRKNEPKIVYNMTTNPNDTTLKNIVYGAVQEKVVRGIVEACDTLGVDIVRIDLAYTSLLRTMNYCERFNKFFENDTTNAILLVTSNTCTVFNLKGKTLIKTIEEPLAIKSFSIEEVYAIISKTAAKSMDQYQPQSLLIISEADEINAEQLAATLNFKGEIDYINKNASNSDEFIAIDETSDIDSSMISYITLEGVGAAVADYDDFPLDINFLPADRIRQNIIQVGEYEVDLSIFVALVLGVAAAIVGIAWLAISSIINQQIQNFNNDKYNSEEQINIFKGQTSGENQSKKDIFPVLQQISENNKTAINVYNGLSSEIPEDIYIKRFVKNPEGGIGIMGESKSSESVNNFIKGLKEKNPTLMVSKLSINEIGSNANIPNGVTFEIKTSNIDVMFVGDVLDSKYQSNGNNNGDVPNQPPII